MSEPLVSAVLAIDAYATGAACVEALTRQTIAPRVELVLVGPDVDVPQGATRGLHSVQVLDHDLANLTEARAAGILAAGAPCVFVAETHALPEPDCLELLAAAVDTGAAAAMPRFANANPKTARSWASLFATYGSFTGEARSEPDAVSLHNGAFRRDVLARVAASCADELVYGIGLSRVLRDEGSRMAYVPEAVVEHVNVAAPQAMVLDRLWGSRIWAAHRARSWSRARRLTYAVGSPLVPFAVLAGVLRSDGWRSHREDRPRSTLAVLALSTIPIALGELLGYTSGPGKAQDRIARTELHRDDYV